MTHIPILLDKYKFCFSFLLILLDNVHFSVSEHHRHLAGQQPDQAPGAAQHGPGPGDWAQGAHQLPAAATGETLSVTKECRKGWRNHL